MATKTITVPVPDDHAEPAWEVALLFPDQGEWSEDDYLWLTDHTRCLVGVYRRTRRGSADAHRCTSADRPLSVPRPVCIPGCAWSWHCPCGAAASACAHW